MEKKTRNGHGSIIGLCNTNKKDNLRSHNTKGKIHFFFNLGYGEFLKGNIPVEILITFGFCYILTFKH
jgi:hypothetical protein